MPTSATQTTTTTTRTSEGQSNFATFLFLGLGAFIVYKLANPSTKAKFSSGSDGLKPVKIRGFNQLSKKEQLDFPHVGTGKYRVYVSEESGSKDHYFKTRPEAVRYYERMELRYSGGDPKIDKVRPGFNIKDSEHSPGFITKLRKVQETRPYEGA